jgi:hypothetical protein
MRKVAFAPAAFAAAFCCAYILLFAMNWPLFLYYPLHGDFTWGPQALKGVGPAMAWYGLMAGAGIIAAFVAVIVPDRIADRALRNYVWLFPCVAMFACIFLLRRFFLG